MFKHYILPPALLLAAVLFTLSSCTKPVELVHLSGKAQGSSWHVSYWSEESKQSSADIEQQLNAELQRIDMLMSTYRADSVISRFNQTTSTEPFDVGNELVSLVEQAREVSTLSGGCYDLTVAPLYELWGFQQNQFHHPDANELNHVKQATGMDKLVKVDESHLQKQHSALQMDVSSNGQGYTTGRMAKILEDAGIQHYLAEIGGELQTKGHKPDGSFWRIAIERPLPGEQQMYKILEIKAQEPTSIITSGTYRHYFDHEGKRYSHILDGNSGQPVTHNTVLVSIVMPDAALGDAWSTALLCLGKEQGIKLAEQQQIAALFVELNTDGTLTESASEQWRNQQSFVEVPAKTATLR